MANHQSAKKRIRSSEVKRVLNRYQHKTVRNAIRKFMEIKEKESAVKEYNRLSSLIDKLAKKNVIHKNTAANKKSNLAKYILHLSN